MKLTDKAMKLIDGKNFASVATLMADGFPQVAPVWVDRDGDVIILNATRSRQRTKNLKKIRGLQFPSLIRIIHTPMFQSEERLSKLPRRMQKSTSTR